MKAISNLKLAVLILLISCIWLASYAGAVSLHDTLSPPANSQPHQAGLSPDQLRIQAVQRARVGEYQPAVDALEEILAGDPDNVAAYHDLLIILGWAEQDRKVLRMAEQLDSAVASVEVVNTVAKSARNVGDFALSVNWYSLAVARAPARLESNFGLALALADLGQYRKAFAVLSTLPLEDRESAEMLMVQGYIHHRTGGYPQAIATFDLVLAKIPEHRGALRGKILALQRLLLPAEAMTIASAHRGLLSDDELARLQADWAAVQIRWANQTATPKSFSDRSLKRALQSISLTVEQFSDNNIVQQRARFDRIVAYRSQRDMLATVAEYEKLDATSFEIPVYVLGAAAGAYLHLRQPEIAEKLLLQALRKEPGNFVLHRDMFWVLVDLERQQEALALAEELRGSQPMWLEVPGSPVVRANPRRLQAEIMVGLALSFMDQLPQAQAQFEQLLATAPHNTDLQHELATVLRRRGWPERALFEYQQALTTEPDLVAAAVGTAHTSLDRRQFELGEGRMNRLIDETPDRLDVLQLVRRWSQINEHRFRIDSSIGKSSGDQFGSEQYSVDGYLSMKPLHYRFRPFIHSTDAYAEFPEGDGLRRRLGFGIEYRSMDWTGSLELHRDRSGGGDFGMNAIAEWIINDRWSVGGNWEIQSAAIPLRGHRAGLDAEQLGLRLEYRASELRNVSLSGEQIRISDGNTRYGWSLQGRQRAYTRPAYKLDLDAEIFVSSGDAQDTVYFNPRHDASFLVTAANTWRTYRRYDFAFTQQFNVGFGYYRQSSHGTSPVGSLQYLGNVDVNAGFSVQFGLEYGRRVYDGDAEYATFFTLGVAGSF